MVRTIDSVEEHLSYNIKKVLENPSTINEQRLAANQLAYMQEIHVIKEKAKTLEKRIELIEKAVE